MATVLLVEDDPTYMRDVETSLRQGRPGISILFATLLCEVPGLLEKNQVDLIVWDELLPDGRASNTAIPEASKTFRGPMIANSNFPVLRRAQLLAGCTHEKGTQSLTSLVLELLARIP